MKAPALLTKTRGLYETRHAEVPLGEMQWLVVGFEIDGGLVAIAATRTRSYATALAEATATLRVDVVHAIWAALNTLGWRTP